MIQIREVDPLMGELYLAGELVPPGKYREIHCGRILALTTDDVLPASLNGQVACYHRLNKYDLATTSMHVGPEQYS